MAIFTKEELLSFHVDQLERLAAYFGIDTKKYIPKAGLVELIYEKIEEKEVENLPIESARVRRIRERMKENGQ